jgi:hypothetical protein
MGVDQLSSASGTEKNKHYSLPAFSLPGSCPGGSVCDACRTDSSISLHSGSSGSDRFSAYGCKLPNPQDGDQLRRGIGVLVAFVGSEEELALLTEGNSSLRARSSCLRRQSNYLPFSSLKTCLRFVLMNMCVRSTILTFSSCT